MYRSAARPELGSDGLDGRTSACVLIVAGDSKSRTALRSQLCENFDVLTASSAEKAIELSKARCPDLIVLDACHRPAHWSQLMIGTMEPPCDRHIGATP